MKNQDKYLEKEAAQDSIAFHHTTSVDVYTQQRLHFLTFHRFPKDIWGCFFHGKINSKLNSKFQTLTPLTSNIYTLGTSFGPSVWSWSPTLSTIPQTVLMAVPVEEAQQKRLLSREQQLTWVLFKRRMSKNSNAHPSMRACKLIFNHFIPPLLLLFSYLAPSMCIYSEI